MAPNKTLFYSFVTTVVTASLLAACSQPNEIISQASIGSVSCPNEVIQIAKKVTQIKSVKNRVWNSFDHSNIRLGVNNADQDLYLMGYSKDDYQNANMDADLCLEDQSVAKIKDSDPFFNPPIEDKDSETFGMIMLYPENFYPNFKSGNGIALINQSKVPLNIIAYDMAKSIPKEMPNGEYLKKLLSDPDYFAVVLVHELFHQYQHKYDVNMERRFPNTYRDISECNKNFNFKYRIQQTKLEWRRLRVEIREKRTDAAIAKAKSTLKSILDQRRREFGSSQKCFESVAYGEWGEGSAVYVSTELAKRAKLNSRSSDYFSMWEDGFDESNPALYRFGTELFYVTGAIMIEAITFITGSNDWQKEFEDKGKLPSEIARSIVGN